MITARELALKILYDIDVNDAYSNIELKKNLDASELSQVDKGFVTELVYGVVKYKLSLDYCISSFSTIKLHKLSKWIINILRMGIYQIKYLDKIPDSAAVNECVNLAKKYGNAGSIKFVNGLLRNYIRNSSNIKNPDKGNEIEYLSINYSHPEWLVNKWINEYGFGFAEDLCSSNNTIPNLTARVNSLKCTKNELIRQLSNEGITTRDAVYFYNAVIIDTNTSLSSIKSFNDGLFQIQDESSMMVGSVLKPQKGQAILDVCAAPGGKSTHIAELMGNEGTIFSRDIHTHKLRLIEENANRLGINIINTQIFDATCIDNNLIDKCDGVVVDAPCSGLGIIRRKPDIKWNKELSDTSKLVELQKTILLNSAKYVKPGGTLVYSTCTINNDENLGVIMFFLNNNLNFKLVDISPYLPKKLIKESCKDGYIQTYPNIDGIDGFFVARMERVN